MRYDIYNIVTIAHITQKGNVSIPKSWREQMGIEANSSVLMEMEGNRIIIEPLRKKTKIFEEIDEEIKNKGIKFTREEAIKDDLYD